MSRCEVQLARNKQICENLEKNEDEMRAEKRRLQRDVIKNNYSTKKISNIEKTT